MQIVRMLLLACLLAVLTACGTQATAAPLAVTPAATTPALSPTAVVPVNAVPSPTIPVSKQAKSSARAAASQMLVSLRKSGGITGKNETLTVYTDGRIEFTDRSGQVRVGQVTGGDLEKLRGLLNSSALAQAKELYETSGADLMSYEITLVSGGKLHTITTMDAAQHPEIIDQVITELVRLRPTNR